MSAATTATQISDNAMQRSQHRRDLARRWLDFVVRNVLVADGREPVDRVPAVVVDETAQENEYTVMCRAVAKDRRTTVIVGTVNDGSKRITEVSFLDTEDLGTAFVRQDAVACVLADKARHQWSGGATVVAALGQDATCIA